ncbi:DUF937 domain-containing protein [Tuanshanicoccus lijuaniae]|uniref:DUF937 domain-containing protein n=1 Tax=Aerococcaceae bacterium zg-1292 TaxID=2774330 RepID=UPI001934FFE3|nr:DUF937 domain-containing protein [Aerococcaceae bacterium zg-1292]MBF6625694.1 DUF937 domain-containing protein [Aerococcaceae bacterium zg-BR9]MBF6977880.1 DUF937 domain-containing protein [Aerococcaceae bacterium zg-BR22]MBS4455914.1 DUF937 domain-containing protein [Aerococcaceae bacterium zg-A91]MBS4457548.1 DUF937 domain-containing protein [Aerococcaceae bacterium zg-BR33]
MSIFENVGSLIDLFSQGSQTDVQAISERAGIDSKQASSVISLALPLILKAINHNTQTDEGLQSFDNALAEHANDPSFPTVAEQVNNVDMNDGSKMLDHIIPNQQGIIDKIADTLGLTPEGVRNTLVLVAPLLIHYLAKSKNNRQLTPEQIREQAAAEQRAVEQETNNGGLLGGLLEGVFGQMTHPKQQETTENNGLLGSLFDLLK